MSDIPEFDFEQVASGRPLEVGMLLFDGVTFLDFIGPHTAFASAGMAVHLVSDTLDPVVGDTGVSVLPTTTLDDCPERLDVLFVPGGHVGPTMRHRAKLDFLTARADTPYITSVCTGSLVLAAAGLLDGYRAATHWATRHHLARLGVEVSTERVCVDRNRISGGGVTAGIDFGLALVAHLRGEETAKLAQLAMEYTPAPPFDAGSPESAGTALVDRFNAFAVSPEQSLHDAVSHVLDRRTTATA
ncbi:DJ-1/PfpI family protein [Saccharothrix coeruleofusca]|uniref:Glutamine amidotransferase n=1 Tax=Saccharothrix coeruleofusca TaxID=33919 RepID=A0A918ECH1_9PSEU|nr:DJ-1/PfpI family protein [Saccharothrix coeruleofusca]GGP43383.1 glutamine amidotransferase [Saccharothrix coeruleofusca]